MNLEDLKENGSGRYFEVVETGEQFPMALSYETLVDLDRMTCCDSGDTLEALIAEGKVVEKSYIERECLFALPEHQERIIAHGGDLFDYIKEYFHENGFEVSIDAIRHQYDSWSADVKSGYRGEDYFLRTPCNCNPFTITAMTLSDKCSSWQKTY